MNATLDLLLAEHRLIARLLSVLERELEIFQTGERPDYELIATIIEYFGSYPDRYHHPKEEIILAKLVRRDQAAAEIFSDLTRGHEELAALTRRFADGLTRIINEDEVPRGLFDRLARDFIDYQRLHMGREEADFFPAAAQTLTAEDWAAIEERQEARPDPLLGGPVDPRFVPLQVELAEIAKRRPSE